MNITPLFDRVVIEEEPEKSTSSGIFLGNTRNDSPRIGTVVHVGPGNDTNDGKKTPMYVKKGDKVLFGKYSCVNTQINNKNLLIIRQTDILAILN